MHLQVADGLVALALMVAVAAMLAVAPMLRVPYPILLVVGGLVIGLVPGMPELELEPEIVFFGVLPPLLYSAAFFTSLRDLRAGVRPIGLLAVGLVVVTTVGVAVVAHTFVDGLSWPSAFVLGAIVSPTDPLAATSRSFLFAVPFALLLSGVTLPAGGAHASLDGVALAVASGALTSGVGYSVWYAALRHLTATSAAVLQLTVPILAAVAAILFLGESVTARFVVASGAILGGVFLTIRERGR